MAYTMLIKRYDSGAKKIPNPSIILDDIVIINVCLFIERASFPAHKIQCHIYIYINVKKEKTNRLGFRSIILRPNEKLAKPDGDRPERTCAVPLQ